MNERSYMRRVGYRLAIGALGLTVLGVPIALQDRLNEKIRECTQKESGYDSGVQQSTIDTAIKMQVFINPDSPIYAQQIKVSEKVWKHKKTWDETEAACKAKIGLRDLLIKLP